MVMIKFYIHQQEALITQLKESYNSYAHPVKKCKEQRQSSRAKTISADVQ